MIINNRNSFSRESEIRPALVEWIAHVHRDDPSTKILHEVEIPRPSSRIDLAAVNGRISGYEIKAGADSLTRLSRQAASFSLVFERMTLVASEKHLKRATEIVPSWWEIVVCSQRGFRRKKRGRLNPRVDLQRLLYLLSVDELRAILRLITDEGVPNAVRKSDLVAGTLRKGKRTEILRQVRSKLKERAS